MFIQGNTVVHILTDLNKHSLLKSTLTSPEPREVAVVYLLTQAPVIVTTTHIFVVNGMHGHLALSPVLPTCSQARPG